jgi:LAGLIDADG endonuclease
MLLYAGITSISFKYSNFLVKVIKLKHRSQSAGNFFFNILKYIILFVKEESTSETLRNKSVIKKISVHVPKHLKPVQDTQIANYLAGLIDGKGEFINLKNQPRLIITFNGLDASLAYFIKKILGYGKVIKTKNSIILEVSHQSGLAKTIKLVNGKIRSDNILNQIKQNILPYLKNINQNKNNTRRPVARPGAPNKNITNFFNAAIISNNYLNEELYLNNNTDLNNYWLTGFSDVTSCFKITVLNKDILCNSSSDNSSNKVNTTSLTNVNVDKDLQLNFQIKHNNKELLILIKNFFDEASKEEQATSVKKNSLICLKPSAIALRATISKENIFSFDSDNIVEKNISIEKNDKYFIFSSSSFETARKIILFFDKYHLLSHKTHVDYLKWRKTYCRLMDNNQFDYLQIPSALKKFKRTIKSISGTSK